ncbi:hypothetical protein IW262DRAFT_68104 [Armillaria fumosa]|nr:hypothetical protein IW262DRAFT_68104 [Armillaria fumosa]
MTVPCGIAVLCFLPDLPSNTRAFYLTEEEKKFALDKAIALGKSQAGERKFGFSLVKRMLTTWKWYAFVLGYVVYGTSCQAGDYFSIWMKAAGYSVAERNVIPSCSRLISVFCIFMWGFGSDLTGSRFTFIFGPLCYGLLPNGILAFWPKSQELILFAFMTNGVQLMTAVFYTWANEIMAGDDDLRALAISSMNDDVSYIPSWLPVDFWICDSWTGNDLTSFLLSFSSNLPAKIIIVTIKLFADRDARRIVINQDVEDNSGTEEKEVLDSEEDKNEAEVLGKDEKD